MPIIIKRKVPPTDTAPVVMGALFPRAPSRKRDPGKVLDDMCLTVTKLTEKVPVGWYLMASYLYYVHDLPLLSDELYDQLSKAILEDYEDIEHRHRSLLSKEALAAGTMYHVRADQYPLATRGAAAQMVSSEWGIKIDIYKDCDAFEAEG